MRKLITFLVGFIALSVFGMSQANAGNSFDGQNYNPEYMTGITEVYAWSDQGNYISVPVYSMEPCELEDGASQIACVWVSSQQGNLISGMSFLKLGDGQTATISNYAAEILVIPGLLTAPNFFQPEVTQQVSQVISQDYTQQVSQGTTEWNAYGVYTGDKAPCANEDSSQINCYWDADTMGLQDGGMSFTVDPYGNYIYGTNH